MFLCSLKESILYANGYVYVLFMQMYVLSFISLIFLCAILSLSLSLSLSFFLNFFLCVSVSGCLTQNLRVKSMAGLDKERLETTKKKAKAVAVCGYIEGSDALAEIAVVHIGSSKEGPA